MIVRFEKEFKTWRFTSKISVRRKSTGRNGVEWIETAFKPPVAS